MQTLSLSLCYLYVDLCLRYTTSIVIAMTSTITTTNAPAAPIIMLKGNDDNDDDDDDDGLVRLAVIQSSESNESSTVGQSAPRAKVIPCTATDGSSCTHWLIEVTISSAFVIDIGTCKVIFAR